jgi:BirA family biotin operon repressor/biotin-[acetyl-CoA-carboxylase] ligase
MTDSLAPDVVEPLLRGRFGRPYVHAEACASTQLLLDGPLPEGAVAVCEEQTAGRGRLGRQWVAPRGTAVLASTLLRPRVGRPFGELSLVAGLAVAECVETALARPAQVKWPNDVLVDGRKVAGVLAEARDEAVRLGIGLNVNQSAEELPASLRPPAGSLRGVDGEVRARAALLADLLVRLELHYDAWCASGLDGILGRLRPRDFLVGRRVAVDGVEGTADGIDGTGALVLETVAGRRLVHSGEVTWEE